MARKIVDSEVAVRVAKTERLRIARLADALLKPCLPSAVFCVMVPSLVSASKR